MGSTITVQSLINSARIYPDLVPVGSASGFSMEPALTVANDVMQRFLAEPMDWKFNRGYVPPIITVALQQDYVTNVTDMAWLEEAWRIDINNTSIPQPVYQMETVRDLSRTYYQSNPFNLSWVPNKLAFYGTWAANTKYPTGLGLGLAQTPVSPIQQFIDANGNILKVTVFGTSGSAQPFAAPGAAVGTAVSDGTVTWSVIDPNGVAIRTAPMPASSGIVWQVNPVYQKAPPAITTLQQTIDPIPDSLGYLFRQGFFARLAVHARLKDARDEYVKWEEDLKIAVASADREREDASFYPSEGLMGGGGANRYGVPIGPAFPYTFGPY